ncbi:MAG: 1-(5-phosphoribosyl)-5-[(5-phosphoribosylamino)methylideneamino]imidazole-4-carboxamide isomerase [Endomicrobiia bacterium]
MIIIPALDLHQGKCVRLTQGRLDKETVYSNDPVFIAKLWQSKGARRLHLVDLDGAYIGSVQHWEIIKQIRKNLNIMIEFGGGVRSLKTVSELDKIGIDKVIISTIVLNNPKEAKEIVKNFKEKIIVAVDVKENKIAVGGWKEEIPIKVVEFLEKVRLLEVKEIILTDIDKEGMLEGFNFEKVYNMLNEIKNFGFDIIISGGVTTIEDIKKIKSLEQFGVKGLIIGKALYAETIKFEEAVKVSS